MKRYERARRAQDYTSWSRLYQVVFDIYVTNEARCRLKHTTSESRPSNGKKLTLALREALEPERRVISNFEDLDRMVLSAEGLKCGKKFWAGNKRASVSIIRMNGDNRCGDDDYKLFIWLVMGLHWARGQVISSAMGTSYDPVLPVRPSSNTVKPGRMFTCHLGRCSFSNPHKTAPREPNFPMDIKNRPRRIKSNITNWHASSIE